ncbi:Triosephosphate isomerase [Pisolithus croceorrhizus]|nr:Triosephosphate isomerase [Pisolithus croceorrhizus]KAI6131766.1 Triosephosphate isomerase [Pisolithus croceorrhizus]KAI6162670.1 Triosephosphate isomerase [Pisolithus thermaeus]
MSRQFFVSGNCKMSPISRAQKIIINELNAADLDPNTEVVIAPPSLYLLPLKDIVRNDIKVSAQNCYYKTSGAYTGEITQLADASVPYVILGHSERRTLFHETSELLAQKTKAALDGRLSVILCVGETLQEREAGQTTRVVEKQLRALVTVLIESEWGRVVIAHGPVWAIGTGKVHVYINICRLLFPIIRGLFTDSRSVTASNCKELSSQIDVDGCFVGGASLKPEFVDIIGVRRN